VEQNVAYGLDVRGVPKAERHERAMEALAAVHMAAHAAKHPNQLSGGQQQRVSLARALVIHPDVLLLDEPLSNLDAKLRTEMRAEIRRLHQEVGITAIYVTHDQAEAITMADRIAVMNEGHIEQVGPPREIYNEPANAFVAGFIGETNFIDGTVESACDGEVTLATPVGSVRGRWLGEAADGLEPGSAVRCSVRPECVDVVDDTADTPPASNRLAARVASSVYHGSLDEFVVEVGEGDAALEMKATMHNPGKHGRRVGDSIAVVFRPEDVVVLRP
jgi:ABC-type Fe3+/spermidine/putrescine transport system ATPase subunit